MAKHQRKVQAAMTRRFEAHTGFGSNQDNKHRGPKPGSQNRRKAGYGGKK